MTTNNTAAALAALDAKHAAARAQLEAEHAVAGRATVPPVRVQLTSGGLATWLTYQADDLAAALAIMAAAPIVPAYAYKGTFTRIQPETLATDKSGDVVAGPFAASLDVSQGEGFGPSAKLRFFVMAGDDLCEAHVDIGPRYSAGAAWRWGAGFTRDPRGRGKGRDDYGREVRGEWRQNTTLAAMSDHLIRWGSGADTSAHFQYFWMADTVEGGADHAAAQLATLAGEAR